MEFSRLGDRMNHRTWRGRAATRARTDVPSLGIRVDQTLVFDFDSLGQRNIESGIPSASPAEGADNADQVLPFSGVLRAADLLSRRILLLDSQLLDGTSFLTLGPVGIRDILARTESFHDVMAVAARKPCLAESLRHLLLDEKDPSYLRRFEFSSLASFSIDAGPLIERLHARSSKPLRECARHEIARTVACELQAAAEKDDPRHTVPEPTGPFAQLEKAWNSWITESDSGRLPIQEWSGTFPLSAALVQRPLPTGLLAVSNLPVQQAIGFLSDNYKRTEVLAYLRDHRLELEGYGGLLRDWWMNAYFDALAAMHGSNWLRFSADPGTQDSMPRRRLGLRRRSPGRASSTIQFQGSLVSTLDEMPGPVYAVLRHQARVAIGEWQSHPSQKTSDGLAYAVARADATQSRRQARRAAWTRVGLTLVPAFVGTVTADAFSNLFAGIGSAVAAALVGVPLVEFFELHESGKKKMRAHIHFPAVRLKTK